MIMDNTKITIIWITMTILIVLTLFTLLALGAGSFKQSENVYYCHDYERNPETGLVSVDVKGEKLSVKADKIIYLPTDHDSGNMLFVNEYKTSFFSKTYYEVDKFVILIPVDNL